MEQHHHLAAILFTDIVGYTAMMQKDEQQAVAVIRQYNAALEKSVAGYHGRVLNNYGDGSLCTFSSATEAVNCAIQIQHQLLHSEPSVPLRIGLHVGELFFEDDKAFGDGVNIASRIQSLGQANTILFSKELFDKIRNQIEFKSVSLGRFEFKNVDEPIEVFALANDGLTIPKRESMEGKLKRDLPNSNKGLRRNIFIAASLVILVIAGFFIYSMFSKKPGFTGKEKSIAVLPFANMSPDKENEYFSDGMTEEITTQLSKIADLKVIARTSAMQYKDSKKSVKQIAEELGVSSILEGSVQKAGNNIRITAQLIDAATQQHIWADKWDREFKEIFVIQSEVAEQIAYQLNVKLTSEEKKRIETAPTNNPEAYNYYLRGNQIHVDFFNTKKLEHFENSRAMFQKALELDSNYVLALAGLADLYNTYTSSRQKIDSQMIKLQVQEIEKAWRIDSTNDYVNNVKGSVEQAVYQNSEKAFRYFKRAAEINPNSPTNLWGLAVLMMANLGLAEDAKLLLDRTIELDPLTANNFLMRGIAFYFMNKQEDALKDINTAIQLEPDFIGATDMLSSIYVSTGRLNDAKKALDKTLQLKPDLNEHWPAGLAFVYAKLGNKKKALELAPNDWPTLLALGMKEEALKAMPHYYQNKKELNSQYLFMKSRLATKDFEPIKNDPRFLEILERNKKQYEENKKKFSIIGLLN